MEPVSVVVAVAILNRALDADPVAVSCLVNNRIPCNDLLANDPSVQVGHTDDDPLKGFEVGMLGIINGIFGTRPDRVGWIAAICDGPLVLSFVVNDQPGED